MLCCRVLWKANQNTLCYENNAIKTLKMKSTPTALDFYILSEGYNAGKPMAIPCSNCFVVQAADSQEKVKLYWICYSIWKYGVYIPLLRGLVTPSLRIHDVSTEIQRGIEKIDQSADVFNESV
jgi:hypothetical protein